MSQHEQSPLTSSRPVLPWRMVAGGLIHFAVAGYLVVVPVLCLLLAPAHASAETVARLALRLSLWFLVGLVGLVLITIPATIAADRVVRARRHRAARAPAIPDRSSAEATARVERATHATLGEAAVPLLARIAAARWNHDDTRYQALARDLDEVVRAATVALASAPPDRRLAISATTAEALARIAAELDALAAANAQADEAQVQLLSRYLDARYPALDSPLRPD